MGAAAVRLAGRRPRHVDGAGAGLPPTERVRHSLRCQHHRSGADADDADRDGLAVARGFEAASRRRNRGDQRRHRTCDAFGDLQARSGVAAGDPEGITPATGVLEGYHVSGNGRIIRAVDAAAGLHVDVRRSAAFAPARERMALGAGDEAASGFAGGGHLAAHSSKAGAAAAHRSPRPAAGIGRRRRAYGDWLAAARRSPSGQRAGGAVAPAGRGDSGSRARAHPPARLSRQPAADARRDAAVLSPGRLVALAADSSGARELLRRSCRQPLRRSLRVRQSAGGSRRAEGHFRPSCTCRNGRLAASARSPARRSAIACGARAWLGGRHRGAPADDRRGGRSDWQRAVPPRPTQRHPVEREPGGQRRSLRSAGCRAGRQRAS